MRKNKGVTVIELLVALAVFSVLLFIVLGMGMDQVGRAGLKGSANELIGEINTVRGRAAKENRPVALTFTSDSYKEHFFESGIWTPILSDNTNPDGTTARGITLTASSTIVFNSRGVLVDPTTFLVKGNILITFLSDKSEGIKVKVYSYGGIKTKNTWRDYNEYSSF